MQTQFQYIVDLAKQYHSYTENPETLFNAINNLNKNVVEDIFNEYGDLSLDFKPVNLLRAEIARLVMEGVQISENVVNEIKEYIRNRDTAYFSTYSTKCLDGLTSYKTAKEKGDYFTAWNVNWRVFFVYFYRGIIKDTVRLYLNQIGLQLKSDLGLNDYELHTVDFFGPANFGSNYCWLALYPVQKYSHQDSYQFFLQIGSEPIAGRMAGHSIKNPVKDEIHKLTNYQEVLSIFLKLKPEIIKLNNESRNYFKFAPGSQAVEWNNFFKEGVAAVDYANLNIEDISMVNSLSDLNKIAGFPEDSQSNQTWNLWLFKTANIRDIVFATKGVNICLGIGIITSNYYFEKTNNNYNHRRKVKWITDKVYQYKSNTLKNYKNLFRPDTFSPTVVHDFILNEYIRNYPELEKVFKENKLLVDKIIQTDQIKKPMPEVIREGENSGSQFVRFWKPLLSVLQELGGSGKPAVVKPLVVKKMNISEEELAVKVKTGTAKILNQIDWARNSLKDLGFISAETRGLWKLTEKGLKSKLNELDFYPPKNEDIEVEPLNFWWLNANPKRWSMSSLDEGEKETYTTHNEKGNKRRIYKYFEETKPGDLIIGYESTPTKQIKAIFEISKGIHNTTEGEKIEFQLIEKLDIPVHWNDVKNIPTLLNCEVFRNNQGSLFKLTEEEYDIIREVIDNKNIITENPSEIKKYKFSEDIDKPFIKESDFLKTVSLLKRKKNIILQGPPGVGKTFIARKIAYEILQEIKDSNIEMVQFHQSYSYEDFIQGLRPTQNGGFDLKDGIFYTFCQKALAHPDRQFFFIIDEINRGNLSKIFGEMMMLIEADKRSEKFALKLTYSEDEEDRFYIPENIFIIGTMNTADRSLAIVDYALRRRFAFVTLHPDYGVNFNSFLSAKGLSPQMVEHICSSVSKVNSKIKDDINLGEGFQIGHSYFCTYETNEDENSWWNDILNFELKPLLEEIWFDDSTKVDDALKQLSK
ncbi:MAG: AAA family ATPase [Candidatus Kapabacteria bacterium]|nr:AAA family ATPase [Candidatus Kapabacteria bacterium]